MPFLTPNQQCHSTEGNKALTPTSGLASCFLHPSRTPDGRCVPFMLSLQQQYSNPV